MKIKRAGVATFISQKIDFKGHRRSLYSEKGINSIREYNNVHIYAPNTRAPRYIMQILNLKGQTDFNTWMMRRTLC